jgi:hypothetical protein
MKDWLGSAAKFVAEYLILLAIFASAGAFATTVESPGIGSLALAAAHEAQRIFPLALSLTLGLGLLSFRASGRKPASALISVAALGILMAALGVGLRLVPLPSNAPSRLAPLVGVALEAEDRLVSIRSIEGRRAHGVAIMDFGGTFPRLSWTDSLVYREETRSIVQGNREIPVARMVRPHEDSSLPLLAFLSRPLREIENLPIPEALTVSSAFILLCVGLASPALGMAWPLAGLSFAIIAIATGIAGDLWLSTPAFVEALRNGAATLGLRDLAPVLPGAVIEALVGILGAGLGLFLARKRAS